MTEPTDRHRAAAEEISDVASPHYGTHDELAAILARHFPDLALTPDRVREMLGAMLRTELDPRVDVPRNGAIRDCARALGVELD